MSLRAPLGAVQQHGELLTRAPWPQGCEAERRALTTLRLGGHEVGQIHQIHSYAGQHPLQRGRSGYHLAGLVAAQQRQQLCQAGR
jgi:hypothetical protein